MNIIQDVRALTWNNQMKHSPSWEAELLISLKFCDEDVPLTFKNRASYI